MANGADVAQSGLGAAGSIALAAGAPIAPFLIAGAALLGLFRGLLGKKPKPPPPPPISTFLRNPVSQDRALPVVYGTVEVLPGGVWVQPAGLNSRQIYAVYDVCHGEIDKIGKVRFTDPENVDFVTEAGSLGKFPELRINHEGVKVIDVPTTANSCSKHLGAETQSADTMLTNLFGSAGLWTTGSQGAGIAYFAVRLTNGANNFPWAQGLTPVACSVRGRKVYDPRIHNGPATKSFSSNPPLCILDHLMNDRFGWGLPLSEIHTGSFENAADHCDDQSVTPDETQSRYECNGLDDTGRTLLDRLQLLLTSCNGHLTLNNGQLFLYIPQSQSLSGLAITPQNTIGTHQVVARGAADLFNEVHGFYLVSGSSGSYVPDEVTMPTGSTNPFLADDNDFPLVASFTLPFTTDRHQAERLMGIALKRGRQRIITTRTCNEELLQAVPGDIVTITDPSMEWENKQFEVLMTEIPSSAQIRLTLVSYDADDFNETLEPKPASENIGLDSPFNVPTPIDLSLSAPSGGDRLTLTWAITGSGDVQNFQVGTRKISGSVLEQTDTDWKSQDPATLDDMRANIFGVRDGDIWQGRVRARNGLNVFSEWVTSSVVTVQTHEIATATYALPIVATGSVTYPVTMSATTDHVRFYHEQATVDTLQSPSLTGEFAVFERLETGSSIFTIESVSPSVTTYFKTRAVAYNIFDEPNFLPSGATTSSFFSTVPRTDIIPLDAPSALSASVTTTAITLMWTTASAAETELWLDGQLNVTKAANVATHSFTDLASNTLFNLKARHHDTGSYSEFSSTLEATTLDAQLDAPTDCKVSQNIQNFQFNGARIIWTNAEPDASIEVWGATSPGALALIATKSPGTSDHREVGVSGNYCAKVRHVRSGYTNSAFSNTDCEIVSS